MCVNIPTYTRNGFFTNIATYQFFEKNYKIKNIYQSYSVESLYRMNLLFLMRSF